MLRKTLWLIIGLIIVTIILSWISLHAGKAHAWNNGNYQPTPTPKICNADHKKDYVTPTPTPTASPSAAPIPTQPPSNNNSGGGSSGGGSSTQAPGVCSNSLPGDVPNFIVVPAPNGLELEWAIIPNAQYVDIRYGFTVGNWIYGAVYPQFQIANNGNYTVTGLQPDTSYNFEIAGVNGCAVGNWSNPYDPQWNPIH